MLKLTIGWYYKGGQILGVCDESQLQSDKFTIKLYSRVVLDLQLQIGMIYLLENEVELLVPFKVPLRAHFPAIMQLLV